MMGPIRSRLQAAAELDAARHTVLELRERERALTARAADAADAHAVQLAQRTALVAERDAKIEALTQALEGAALLSQEQAGRTATSTLFLNHC